LAGEKKGDRRGGPASNLGVIARVCERKERKGIRGAEWEDEGPQRRRAKDHGNVSFGRHITQKTANPLVKKFGISRQKGEDKPGEAVGRESPGTRPKKASWNYCRRREAGPGVQRRGGRALGKLGMEQETRRVGFFGKAYGSSPIRILPRYDVK